MQTNDGFGQVNLFDDEYFFRESILGQTCAICAKEYFVTGKHIY